MLKDDIKYLDRIMNIKSIDKLYENYFCWLYPFTNENIKAYYEKIDFKEKTILTITSSGDHLLNAIYLDAKNINAFDTNPLAKYYAELKIAAIKTLSLEEFIIFFYNKNIIFKNKYYFDKETYEKFNNNLKDEYKIFWDYFFNNYNSEQIIKSNLFTNDFLDLKKLIKVNNYLNEDNYYKLREKLNNINITYYDYSFKDIPYLNKKYDVLILSNIAAFYENEYYKDSLKDFKNTINKITHNNSQIVVCYLYSNMLDNDVNKGIYDYDLTNKYFNESDYEYISFPCAEKVNSKFTIDSEDTILIKKKTN